MDDLKRVYAMQREVQSRNPGKSVGISGSVYQQACNSGSDGQIVWYRLAWLPVLIDLVKAGELNLPWIHEGEPDEAVFKALATIPMAGMKETQMDFPFDIEELNRLVQEESEKSSDQ